jgi:hypothetical protein
MAEKAVKAAEADPLQVVGRRRVLIEQPIIRWVCGKGSGVRLITSTCFGQTTRMEAVRYGRNFIKIPKTTRSR